MILSNCFNLTSSGLTNKIYKDCCCPYLCNITAEKGEDCFEILQVEINSDSAALGNTGVTAIDGIAYNNVVFPFRLNTGFNMNLSLCGTTLGTGNFFLKIRYINCDGNQAVQTFDFQIEAIDYSNSWNPTSINPGPYSHNFGSLQIGQTATQSFTFTNEQECDVIIGQSETGSTAVTSSEGSSIQVAGGATQTITFTYAPTVVGLTTTTFSYNLTKCSNNAVGAIRFTGTGTDTPEPPTDPVCMD